MEKTEDKRPNPKLCVFCGKGSDAGKMNAEHFVPRCLWSGKRPSLTLTVPAHVACNSAFAADNDYFRFVLVKDDQVKEHPVVKELLNSTVSRLMNERTRQFLSMAKDFDYRPRTLESGLYVGHQASFSIDKSIMNRVLGNILRGLYYTAFKLPIPKHHILHSEDHGLFLDEDASSFTDRMSEWKSFGDDVFQYRFCFMGDYENMLAHLRFYGAKNYMVFNHPPDLKEIYEKLGLIRSP